MELIGQSANRSKIEPRSRGFILGFRASLVPTDK